MDYTVTIATCLLNNFVTYQSMLKTFMMMRISIPAKIANYSFTLVLPLKFIL